MVMCIMREVNLRSMDLNLLTVLQILLEERHVTRAAERLHMSQSAVSRALQRLRVMFNDQLLVKNGEGYRLSSRAEKISTQLSGMLQEMARLIKEPVFDPSTVKATIRFGGIDLESWIDMPKLVAQVLKEAPNIQIEISSAPADYFELIAKGHIDYMVTGIGPSRHLEGFHSCVVGESELAVVMGDSNPLAKQELTLEKYLNAVHGYISMTGKGPTHTDKYLESVGMKRKVMLKISDFRAALDYTEQTDILFRLPLELIRPLMKGRKVTIKSLPIELEMPKVNFHLYWHTRFHQDPLHAWMKQKILNVRRVSG